MKLADANDRAVLVLGDEIADVATASEGRFGPDPMAPYADWPAFVDFAATVTSGTAPLVEGELRCPVPAPRQVFGIGLNYRSHAEESGMPIPAVPATFTKFPASLGGPFVDGEKMQDARTDDLVFGIPRLVAELSAVLPLLPGDVIFTGTPSGVGMARQPARYLRPGQVVESWIEGIGTIRNPCV